MLEHVSSITVSESERETGDPGSNPSQVYFIHLCIYILGKAKNSFLPHPSLNSKNNWDPLP